MSVSNSVTLIGRFVADPEFKELSTGTSLVKAKMAIDRSLSKEKKAELTSQGKPTADFIPIVLMGKSAKVLSDYTQKGSLIAVYGSIQTNTYNKQDGTKGYSTDVFVHDFKFLDSKKKETTNEFDDIEF